MSAEVPAIAFDVQALAESPEQAASMVAWHAEVEGTPFEVDLDGPEVLAWYPGPFSNDAIVDRCHTED